LGLITLPDREQQMTFWYKKTSENYSDIKKHKTGTKTKRYPPICLFQVTMLSVAQITWLMKV